MSSYLAVTSALAIALGMPAASYGKAGEAELCIRFDVTAQNSQTETREGETQIIQLTSAGTERLRSTTANNIGRTLCVYSDEEILVRAEIRAEISSGTILVQSPEQPNLPE